MNKNFYKNKKILITGCTGFTGGWLILYLQMQGAKIFGYSKKPPFNNSIFKLLKLNKNITFLEGNIENSPLPKKIKANLSNNHLKYALTWYSLALTILLYFLYFRKKQ